MFKAMASFPSIAKLAPPNPPRHRGMVPLALTLFALTAGSACGQDGIPLFPDDGEAGGPPTSGATGSGGAAGSAASSSSGSGSASSGGMSASSSSSSSASSGGNPPPGKPLTILNWNTHDFVDTVGTIGNDALSPADYALKRQTVGAAIKTLNPDIAVLMEIETQAVLDDLNQTELAGAYTSTTLTDTFDIREIALLSKIKPDKVVSHFTDTFVKVGTTAPVYYYTRDCLEMHFTFNGKKVILLGVHFKSKASDDPDRRLAEAQHTRVIADGLAANDPAAAIVVLGDYNDTPGSAPYLAMEGKAPSLFTNSADAAPVSERYSYIFQGMYNLIDHQMINPIMAGVLHPSSVLIKHGFGFDSGKYASDHSPIRATYYFQ
jgi:endonuclease/exonuclease/phosphatase family metal-dependent hydrolase